VQALGYLGASARGALPGIIKLLEDPDERVAWAAAWVLGRLGPDAEESLPALRAALKDSRALVRKQASLALESSDPTRKSTSRSYQEK
jgi:HEAT repeat protein